MMGIPGRKNCDVMGMDTSAKSTNATMTRTNAGTVCRIDRQMVSDSTMST